MTVLVDTSALYALISPKDRDHNRARQTFVDLLDGNDLVSHNYIVVETISLVHARHGRNLLPQVRALLDVLEIVYIDAEIHDAAWERMTGRGRRGPSFVDLVSFEFARSLEISRAFAFDDDFAKEGLQLL